ncbi:hypothetical protein BCR34DRAFT_590937 [Clohesyomyces aquaticus]|uniref:AB hydrolase-1 domain-containing protein n=1 Tax=Clohesyomyces aquaticus TaxID=1231657 RepID=A0A1Y1Z4S7_9PLEO|nr:hypothetical protein BCR34DRAFT_590937 [Clohesyomyces aquaticus]
MSSKPVFVLVPGASMNPTHYAYLTHLLNLAAYPTFSALLPSVGATAPVTASDDAAYVRDRMILPVLDIEERDVILVSHSYSGIPASAAAAGLSKKERVQQGKKTGVLGQVYLAAILVKGGDGGNVVGAFGGGYPPHIRADPEANLLRCDDRIRPLFHDVVPQQLADVAAVSAMAQGMTSFTSPCPRATWDSEYAGRVAYIRTTKDAAIPLQVQQMMIDGTGVDWIVRDLECSHSAQIAQPEKLRDVLMELAGFFETP